MGKSAYGRGQADLAGRCGKALSIVHSMTHEHKATETEQDLAAQRYTTNVLESLRSTGTVTYKLPVRAVLLPAKLKKVDVKSLITARAALANLTRTCVHIS